MLGRSADEDADRRDQLLAVPGRRRPDRYVEVAQYPNWAEHLRQHAGRLTGSDRDLELAALKWADGGPAEVLHLLPVRPPELGHPTTAP